MGNIQSIDMSIQYIKLYEKFNVLKNPNVLKNYMIISVDTFDKIKILEKLKLEILPSVEYYMKDITIFQIEEMLDFYLNHKNSEIYKITDYICHFDLRICIHNTNGLQLRNKIIEPSNNIKYIVTYINCDNISKYIVND